MRTLSPCLAALLTFLITLPVAEAAEPLKVFILAGQSNTEGQGFIAAEGKRNDGKGSLEYLVKSPATAARFKHLVDEAGKSRVREDVWIWYHWNTNAETYYLIGEAVGKAMLQRLAVQEPLR